MYGLIVEPQLRRAARYVEALEAEGIDPAPARNEEEAWAILAARGAPAICVLELTGAGVDGFRLLSETRANGLRMPAVVVSAYGALRDSAWNRREALGISAVLSTELAPAAVRNAVRRALGRPAERLPASPGADPAVEADRLAVIHASGLASAVDTPAALDELIADLPAKFGVEAAVCSVLLSDRELIVAQSGLRGRVLVERGTQREDSIGRHVVEAVGGETLVIEDALKHPTFADNLLVREGVVRGFVGVPLRSSAGVALGALCLLDSGPLVVSDVTVTSLQLVAQRLAGEIDLLPAMPTPESSPEEANLVLGHLKVLLQELDQPIMAWGPEGTVRVVNRALTSALGVPHDRLLGATRAEVAERLTDVIQDAEFLAQLRDMPAEPVTARTEVVVGADRERIFRWRTKPVPLPGGTGQLDLWTDMTAEAALFRAALTDGLTTLANRSGAERAIRRELARADRDRRPLSFLLLDIDHFKRVNDGYGHNAGDGVIRGVAKVLLEVLRASDIAARWGGEEFLVVLPDTDLSLAARVGERIRAAVERGNFGIPARVTVSVGAAQRGPDEPAEATIGRADAWLYEAKETGRNRVVATPWLA